MSSEKKQVSSQTILARLQTAIYANKKGAFFLSILLASLLLLFASNRSPSNPYVYKRYGLGAGDTNGELRTALRRKGDGRAAVAIIRVVGMNDADNKNKNAPPTNANNNDVQYLVQMKSHDYPITAFRGTICLLGGNANKHDATPLDTLKRELNEELGFPDWVNDALDPNNVEDYSTAQLADDNEPLYNASATGSAMRPGTVRYLGTTLHFQSASIISKPQPYAFMCALYEITLRPDQLPPSAIYPRGANIQEGRIILLKEDQLVKHSKYAWGYEYTMEKYFGRKVGNKQKGTAVSVVEEDVWRDTVWTPAK